MRDKFGGYYQPTEEEFAEMWSDGLIVFDTNVLLNLYRYSTATRNKLIHVLEHEKLSERLWIPYQVGLEYQRNRLGVISEQRRAYENIQNSLEKTFLDLEKQLNSSRHPFVVDEGEFLGKIRNLIMGIEEELETGKQEIPSYTEDSIQDTVTRLFSGKIGEPYLPERYDDIFKEGELRFKQEIPPGYKDKTKKKGRPDNEVYGDLIVWNQIIDKAKDTQKPILLVTGETSDDWWWKFEGKTIGRHPHMVEEINEKAHVQFYLYSPDRFIENAQLYLRQEVDQKAVDEIRAIRHNDEELLQTFESLSSQIAASGSRFPSQASEEISGATAVPRITREMFEEMRRATEIPKITHEMFEDMRRATEIPKITREMFEEMRRATEIPKITHEMLEEMRRATEIPKISREMFEDMRRASEVFRIYRQSSREAGQLSEKPDESDSEVDH